MRLPRHPEPIGVRIDALASGDRFQVEEAGDAKQQRQLRCFGRGGIRHRSLEQTTRPGRRRLERLQQIVISLEQRRDDCLADLQGRIGRKGRCALVPRGPSRRRAGRSFWRRSTRYTGCCGRRASSCQFLPPSWETTFGKPRHRSSPCGLALDARTRLSLPRFDVRLCCVFEPR